MTRVYVPTTTARLAEQVGAGRLAPSPDAVVTEGEDEASEYAALMTAADASAALLDGPGRRVVVVAEVADPEGEVPWRDVAAVHADADAAWAPDDDLGWYAVQEVDELLA